MTTTPFSTIEAAARRTHLAHNVRLLNNLDLPTLMGLDLFSWDGLLTIARLTPALAPLLDSMETLERKGFSGLPYVSTSRR